MIRTSRGRWTVVIGVGYLAFAGLLFLACYLPADGVPARWAAAIALGLPVVAAGLGVGVIRATDWADGGDS